MGVSFKVSKTGTRFRPKPPPPVSDVIEDHVKDHDEFIADSSKRSNYILKSSESSSQKLKAEAGEVNECVDGVSDSEVSFTLSLFPDGYSIGKPLENENGLQTAADIPKLLHPYDRASEALFSAIESGRLPGDILDDIPCKYRDGTLVCEVRDYRNFSSDTDRSLPPTDTSPTINKVCLRMSLENVVKDIPSISDNAWTYGDLMEVESRILKALQPQLCLDPCPKLERLCENPALPKLKLDLCGLRRKRLRQIPDVTVNNKFGGKKVCVDRIPEGPRTGDSVSIMQQPGSENPNVQSNGPSNMLVLRTNSFSSDTSLPASPLVTHQSNYQIGGNPRLMQPGVVMSTSGASPAGQEMMSYAGNVNPAAASIHSKRDGQEQSSPLSNLNKRSRLTPMGDVNQQQQVGPQMDRFHTDSHWKNTLLQQQSITRNVQYSNSSMQKYPQQMFEWGLSQEAGNMPFTMGQQGIKGSMKEEPVETERLEKQEFGQIKNDMLVTGSELTNLDSQQTRVPQRLPPQQFARPGFPQTSWNNLGQPLDNNARKDEQFQKRKLVQSPRVSAGGLPQSPLSSKSGEFSSGSVGHQFGNVTSGLVASQKEKSTVTSGPPIGGTTSFTSSANDSMQRQQQAQLAAKRRSNSLPKTPVMSGVGSPASVSNMSLPINASSPPVGTPSLADQSMLERFSKIEMVTLRFELNSKKNKAVEHPIKKSNAFSAQHLLCQLSSDPNNENFKEEPHKMPLSKSLVGGSINVQKTRILTCAQTERILQGNNYIVVPKARTRLIMSEKPNDGTVALHIGDIEDAEYLAAEDYLPTLPNTHIADLLAEQFSKLMAHDGYHVEDHVQPKPNRVNRASTSQPGGPGVPPNIASADMQQYSEGVSGQLSNAIAKPSNSSNTSANPSIEGPRMLSPGNAQALQMSQGLMPGGSMLPRPQHPDQLPSLQQQQQQSQHMLMQQHPQLQRSPLMLSSNPMSHLNYIGQNSNMQLGAHMANRPSPLQLQMLQQQQQQQQQQQLPSQQQQQQQSQIQRKMVGLGNVGIGNLGNNMVGLGALGNVMNAMGARGVGGTGISSPMGSISGIGNVAQSHMSNTITQQLRSGALTPAQAALMTQKLRMAQSKPNMSAGTQSTMGGIAGARQMNVGSGGLSMLGPTINRANINSMQRTAMGPMGPPKLMSGMNPYMPQQQQQQLQLQQQQMQLQQQQQQQQQQMQQLQQQQDSTPLHAVVSPPQIGSPSNMGIPQQMNQQSQQQQHQSSPQQMSQRTPMSPQLSSGAMHPMSAGNMEACPASPQLSSQTLGSVGSITNSPMELQGVNKNNSSSNA